MSCFCMPGNGPKVEIGPKGEEIYRYPSGNVAAVIFEGSKSMFYEDAYNGRLLCKFNNLGEGDIFYETGRPRVALTATDCTFFDPNGDVTRKWIWPRLLKGREEIWLGERIQVSLLDRDNIITKLKLSKSSKVTEFESGRAGTG